MPRPQESSRKDAAFGCLFFSVFCYNQRTLFLTLAKMTKEPKRNLMGVASKQGSVTHITASFDDFTKAMRGLSDKATWYKTTIIHETGQEKRAWILLNEINAFWEISTPPKLETEVEKK